MVADVGFGVLGEINDWTSLWTSEFRKQKSMSGQVSEQVKMISVRDASTWKKTEELCESETVSLVLTKGHQLV